MDWVTNKLTMQPRYFSDALKAETAKTVSEVEYLRGLEYPQHFSRLFKKVGISPTAYRNSQTVN